MIYSQYHTFKWPFLGPNTLILLPNTMSTHFQININWIPETLLPGILPSQFISASIIVLECNIGSGFFFSFFILSCPGPTNAPLERFQLWTSWAKVYRGVARGHSAPTQTNAQRDTPASLPGPSRTPVKHGKNKRGAGVSKEASPLVFYSSLRGRVSRAPWHCWL